MLDLSTPNFSALYLPTSPLQAILPGPSAVRNNDLTAIPKRNRPKGIPKLAVDPPQEIEVEGEIISLKKVRGGCGKNAWVFNYAVPEEWDGLLGSFSQIMCLECGRMLGVSKGSLSGIVSHLRVEHLIYSDQERYKQALEEYKTNPPPRKKSM